MNAQSPNPRARRIARSAMAIAAMSSAAWLATGCVQNPVAPSLSIASHSPAPGRQLASGGSQLKIALEDRAERLRFTDIDKPERMQYTGLEKAERMKFADPAERAERMRFDLQEHVAR